jgi:hypothetical protein
MNTFETVFPTFLTKCGEMHSLLLSVAFALFVTGIIVTVHHRFSDRVALHLGVRLMILTSLLVYLPVWGNTLQSLLHDSIIQELGVDPAQTYTEFLKLLIIKRDPSTVSSWWNVLSELHNFSVDLFVTAVLWLVGHFASIVIFFAYILQAVVLNLGYALSPLLIGFMAIPHLRQIGNRYLMNLVGVLLWPLGWAVAALVTQGLLDFLSDPTLEFMDPTSQLPDLQKTIGTEAIGVWIIFSTFAAPMMIQKVLSAGALATERMFSGAASVAVQTANSTISGAVAGASLGPIGAVAGAGTAGTLTLLSSSAGLGNAGSAVIAPLARFASAKNDQSGDKATRQLLESLKQQVVQLPPILPVK